MNYAWILEASRKAKAARNLYESLKNSNKGEFLPPETNDAFTARDGIAVAQSDKNRVLNLRLHDEHLSPYFVSNMNLFQLLMLDDKVDIKVYKAENGWVLIFEGTQDLPKPFGNQGYDMR